VHKRSLGPVTAINKSLLPLCQRVGPPMSRKPMNSQQNSKDSSEGHPAAAAALSPKAGHERLAL